MTPSNPPADPTMIRMTDDELAFDLQYLITHLPSGKVRGATMREPEWIARDLIAQWRKKGVECYRPVPGRSHSIGINGPE